MGGWMLGISNGNNAQKHTRVFLKRTRVFLDVRIYVAVLRGGERAGIAISVSSMRWGHLLTSDVLQLYFIDLFLKLFYPFLASPFDFFDPGTTIVFPDVTHFSGQVFVHDHGKLKIH